MNEEMNFEATECVEIANEVTEVTNNNIGSKVLIGTGIAGGAALAVVLILKKIKKGNKSGKVSKLDQWRIKRLEKKGYVVMQDLPDITEGTNTEENS